ncbi:MAG: Fe-S cluster assembly protein SufD [Muribaculaceae bacterium]|nr:Fe-S cluster assembly protein SufD [Muribaculaceae bacterium]
MSAIDQYISLYEHNREAIDSNAPHALNRLRPDALSALKRFGRFPGKRDEGYTKVSVEDMFAPDFGVNITRVPFAVDVARSFRCDVPNVSTLLGVVVNDSFRPTATLLKNCPEGVTVDSLASVAASDPDFIKEYLGRLSDNRDAAAALNTLLMKEGVVVRVRAGVKLDKAIQIVNIFNASADFMAVRRVLVVIEDDASARILFCDHSQSGDFKYLSSLVTEVFLHRGASLDYCDIEESTEQTSRMSQLFISQDEGSRLTVNGTSLTVGTTRNEYKVDINGSHCDTEIAVMAIADRKQTIDNSARINHFAPRSRSNQLFKYLLDEQSQGAFEGLIYVAPDAVHTEAYQTDRNLLASADARMHTAPQLEIYCDDVKCSHGAATGQLDQNALFYMQTRGVPKSEARMMLMQAFMSDVIDRVAIEGLRDRLRHLVERRLSGEHAACGDCAASCHN